MRCLEIISSLTELKAQVVQNKEGCHGLIDRARHFSSILSSTIQQHPERLRYNPVVALSGLYELLQAVDEFVKKYTKRKMFKTIRNVFGSNDDADMLSAFNASFDDYQGRLTTALVE